MNSLALLAAAAAFNLVCAGEQETMSLDFSAKEKYTTIFRIDTEAHQWCEDDCTAVNDISRIEPNRIVLKERVSGEPPRDYYEVEVVNRVSGKHSRTVKNNQGRNMLSVFWAGQCEVAPFSGFSKGPQKF